MVKRNEVKTIENAFLGKDGDLRKRVDLLWDKLGLLDTLNRRVSSIMNVLYPPCGDNLATRLEALEKRDKAERIFNFVAKSVSPEMMADFERASARASVLANVPWKAEYEQAASPPTCGSCRWYFETGASEGRRNFGFCRRYPPLADRECRKASNPRVESEWCCGEHSPRIG